MTLDISHFAVDELVHRGLDATHLQLGYHPSWDRWGGDPRRARRTDLLFLGSITSRRDQLLCDAAPYLWDCRADIRLFEFPRPMSRPRGNFVAGEDKWELLASSRIMLNIHRNEVPYFEWVRVLEAVVNGCLVVTESSTDYGPLVPGEHLIAAPPGMIGAYAGSLMTDEGLRAELAGAAYDFVRTKLELKALLEPICTLVEGAGRHPRPSGPVDVRRRPAAPPAPAPSPLLAQAIDTERQVSARIKDLLDGETELLQRVEALQSHIRYGSPDHAEVTATPAWDDFVPEVSVVVTSHNYRDFVTEAMDSTMGSVDVKVELIVVDDHSEDDSIEVIEAFMESTGWFPTLLVDLAANGGVSKARNRGIAEARADRVFVLDADNLVYPGALGKLSEALDQAPDAAFAYGIIAKVGLSGLLSYLPWNVERLTEHNYIDAMSLIRKSVWDEVGGYDLDFSIKGLGGLRVLAAVGRRRTCGASSCREIVGTYRVHATSRQQTVNLDTAPLMAGFRCHVSVSPLGPGLRTN